MCKLQSARMHTRKKEWMERNQDTIKQVSAPTSIEDKNT